MGLSFLITEEKFSLADEAEIEAGIDYLLAEGGIEYPTHDADSLASIEYTGADFYPKGSARTVPARKLFGIEGYENSSGLRQRSYL